MKVKIRRGGPDSDTVQPRRRDVTVHRRRRAHSNQPRRPRELPPYLSTVADHSWQGSESSRPRPLRPLLPDPHVICDASVVACVLSRSSLPRSAPPSNALPLHSSRTMTTPSPVSDPFSEWPGSSSRSVACPSHVLRKGKPLPVTVTERRSEHPLPGKINGLMKLPPGGSFAAHRRQLAPRSPDDQRQPRVRHTPAMRVSRVPFCSSPLSTPCHIHCPRPADSRPPPPTGPPLRLSLSAAENDRLIRAAPCSAPVSGLTHLASRQGVSVQTFIRQSTIRPGLASAGLSIHADASSTTSSPNLHRVPTIPTSGMNPVSSFGTPMSSPTSRRGLTVAIVNCDGEIVAESTPVTQPRSAVDGAVSLRRTESCPKAKVIIPPTQGLTAPGVPRQREIILCRYYHTEGLTCTSSPCRFVHSLEGLSLRGSPQRNDLSSSNLASTSSDRPVTSDSPHRTAFSATLPLRASPRNRSTALGAAVSFSDPTGGTFARAQATSPRNGLRVDAATLAAFKSGDRITVADLDGREVSGYVFKLSGGGKGAGGRARTKFKSECVPHFSWRAAGWRGSVHSA